MANQTGAYAWIVQAAARPAGVTAADVAAGLGVTIEKACDLVSQYQTNHARRLCTAKHFGQRKHYFTTQALADAYQALDPILRVVAPAESPTVRVAYKGRALDIPRPLARRLMRDLAEALA